MRDCWLRQLLSSVLVCLFFFSSFSSCLAADEPATPAAMLHASGKVEVNRSGTPGTMALFSGDSVDTLTDSVANITSAGTSILVMPNSSVKLQSKAVEISQGDVVIATSTGMAAKADDLTITPAAQKQSKFEVSDSDDSVTVAAQQGNVTVSDGQQSSTVQEGQQTTREKKNKNKGAGAVPGGSGGFMSGRNLAIIGGASGAALAGILITQSGSSKKCMSPSGDKNCKCDQSQPANNNCQ
jgi:hypothetical protein